MSFVQEQALDLFLWVLSWGSLVVRENDYKKLRQFEGRRGCSLSSWIRLISIRRTIDFLRSQKQHISMDEEHDDKVSLKDSLADDKKSVEEQLELTQTERMVQGAMEELPSSDRLFVELYYEKELPPEEIANIMGVSINTVYSKKSRLRERMRKILTEKGFDARSSE